MLYSISTNTDKEKVDELAPEGGGIGQHPAGYNLINIVILGTLASTILDEFSENFRRGGG